jgi:hypothetical protein
VEDFFLPPVVTRCGYGRQCSRNTSIYRSIHTPPEDAWLGKGDLET